MFKKPQQTNNVLVANKAIGKTPLDVIKDLKKDPEFKDQKIGYAGRLDPMAEGVLLLLLGDENKNKKKYEDLRKVYKIEILLGFATDTYDILGKITAVRHDCGLHTLSSVEPIIKSFERKFTQEYPPYSSKTVNGKPLYYYARKDLLKKIKIPKRKVEIFNIFDVSKRDIGGGKLLQSINERISLVEGDFRQEEILKDWQNALKSEKDKNFTVISLTVKCSSGTYMRSLAFSFGKKIKIPALALSIKRISVGEYTLN